MQSIVKIRAVNSCSKMWWLSNLIRMVKLVIRTQTSTNLRKIWPACTCILNNKRKIRKLFTLIAMMKCTSKMKLMIINVITCINPNLNLPGFSELACQITLKSIWLRLLWKRLNTNSKLWMKYLASKRNKISKSSSNKLMIKSKTLLTRRERFSWKTTYHK